MMTIRNLMFAGALMFAVAPALAEDAHHPPQGQASAPAATPQAPAATPGMAGGGMRDMMGAGPMGMMRGNAMGMMGLMMAPERIEGRIAFLRAELKITDAQQPLWNSFAEALRSNARDMMGGMQQMMASMQGGTAPNLMQRLDGHERMVVAHLEALRRMKAALNPLYGALDDTQKRTADQLLMPGAMGPM
ncbi:hypothetical protein FQV39_04775 [Bosea sp. F3-2]|nr:Spy/CpxP family protein refolding chaperone [Bosea sp. F3-2]QEL26401.1 hypothetical protein FQV39_04775 [Bosea sp. F3-2]